MLNQYVNVWPPSHSDPPSPNINCCCELAHLGVEGRQERKFQGELCFIMKQITSSRAGLDYATTMLLRDIQRLQDFSYLPFSPVQSGWTLCMLPGLQRNERDGSQTRSAQTSPQRALNAATRTDVCVLFRGERGLGFSFLPRMFSLQ